MKISYNQTEPKPFIPIEISVTIETKEELDRWNVCKKHLLSSSAVIISESFSICRVAPHTIITRVLPSTRGDRSYMGQPFRYLGEKNGKIELLHMSGRLKGELLSISSFDYEKGWVVYVGGVHENIN